MYKFYFYYERKMSALLELQYCVYALPGEMEKPDLEHPRRVHQGATLFRRSITDKILIFDGKGLHQYAACHSNSSIPPFHTPQAGGNSEVHTREDILLLCNRKTCFRHMKAHRELYVRISCKLDHTVFGNRQRLRIKYKRPICIVCKGTLDYAIVALWDAVTILIKLVES